MFPNKISLQSELEALDNNFILILTTNSVEKEEISKGLIGVRKCIVSFDNSGCRIGLLGDRFVVVANGTSGGQKDGTIALIANEFMTNSTMPRPILVAIVGFAWGNPEKVAIWDVIASTEVWSVNHQQYAPNRQRYLRDPRNGKISLASALDVLASRDRRYSVKSGPLLSAAIYHGDAGERDVLLRDFPMALGGEMEAYATLPLLKEAPWIIVKGVSDWGDADNDKANQPKAAANAFEVLQELIPALRDSLPSPMENTQAARLVDTLLDDGLSISASSIKSDYHAYLNSVIAPALLSRLEHYSPEDDPEFSRRLNDAILEILLNAVQHGSARNVNILFNETSLTLKDDGHPFSLARLQEGRGGTHAWKQLQRVGVQRDILNIEEKSDDETGNTYKFTFTRRDQTLRNAREKCPLIKHRSSDNSFEPKYTSFDFDPKCEFSYLDVSRVFMSSEHMNVAERLMPILKAEHGLFIGCDTGVEAEIYKEMLKEFAGPKLRIFVKNRS